PVGRRYAPGAHAPPGRPRELRADPAAVLAPERAAGALTRAARGAEAGARGRAGARAGEGLTTERRRAVSTSKALCRAAAARRRPSAAGSWWTHDGRRPRPPGDRAPGGGRPARHDAGRADRPGAPRGGRGGQLPDEPAIPPALAPGRAVHLPHPARAAARGGRAGIADGRGPRRAFRRRRYDRPIGDQVYEVLREAGEPLRLVEITARLNARGCPAGYSTVKQALRRHAAVESVGWGRYRLRRGPVRAR